MSLGQIQARNLLVSSQVLLHGLLRGCPAFVYSSLVKDRVCSVLSRAFVGFYENAGGSSLGTPWMVDVAAGQMCAP